jgi:phosphoribosylformylglycinamidine cyclo-ligase
MYLTFNCGIGMIVVVAAEHAEAAAAQLREAGETVYTLGQVVARQGQGEQVIIQ